MKTFRLLPAYHGQPVSSDFNLRYTSIEPRKIAFKSCPVG
jgi:hypothetical protein